MAQGTASVDDLGAALAEMARDLLAQPGVQATLDRIVHHATTMVEGCEEAGILVVHRGEVVTVAASGDLAPASDELQGDLREGPCFQAARDGTPSLRITDLDRSGPPWPRYREGARDLGIRSMLAFLLYTRDEDYGSLNLYSRVPGAFTDATERVGWLLASHAAVALAAAHSDERLHTALNSRQRVGQAIGILIERHKITEEEALARLSRHSQNHNVKLRDLAARVVETGEFPG